MSLCALSASKHVPVELVYALAHARVLGTVVKPCSVAVLWNSSPSIIVKCFPVVAGKYVRAADGMHHCLRVSYIDDGGAC